MLATNSRPAAILARMGLEIAPGGIITLSDLHRAETARLEHYDEPVAAVGWTLVSPSFCRGRLPSYQLQDLVTVRPSLDEDGAMAIAALCGAKLVGPFWSNPLPFRLALDHVIDKLDLRVFFAFGQRQDQYGIWPQDNDLSAWQSAYRGRQAADQMMVATILWLFRGGPASYWLDGQPHGWHATEAILTLGEAGHLADWAELVARYPGW